jgi:hypothetical protein
VVIGLQLVVVKVLPEPAGMIRFGFDRDAVGLEACRARGKRAANGPAAVSGAELHHHERTVGRVLHRLQQIEPLEVLLVDRWRRRRLHD